MRQLATVLRLLEAYTESSRSLELVTFRLSGKLLEDRKRRGGVNGWLNGSCICVKSSMCGMP